MAQKSVEETDYVPDRVKKLLRRVDENPFDIEGWNGLIREAQLQSIGKARKMYEKIVTQFQTTGRYWKIYIEHEVKTRNYENAEKLFQRCLIKVLNIDLWKYYLSYVRETKNGLSSFRKKMTEAYDFAIEKIGQDVQSYPIWSDYITFLNTAPAVGSFALNQRIMSVRKIYQKGLRTPMSNVEQLWREYQEFEQAINVNIAKKLLDEANRDYLSSRRVTKELEARTRGLQRHAPSVPPSVSVEAEKQVELWKQYINWEKANPMRSEEVVLIAKRVMFAYEQCLLCLGYHPDVWYEAADYLNKTSQIMQEKGDTISAKRLLEETTNLYERAVSTFMKDNQLIHFAYADFEESRSRNEKVHEIYKRLLAIEDMDHTLTYVQFMKFARRAEGIKSARAIFKKARDEKIRYQVYVAAALMEYHCTKDSRVAFRIYELGLKKFAHEPDFIANYIEYMGHLNEDNNTRVVFERVLTPGSLPREQSGTIWKKYSEFENHVGDLQSLLKIEQRRLDAFKDEYEGKVACLLVDRYRFLDLFPCPSDILRSIGYKDTRSVSKLMGGITDLKVSSVCEEEKDQKSGYVLPDISQLLPYKPKVKPHPGHAVPGGEFPLPGPACQLMKLMPPPRCYRGPFVRVDDLMDKFNDLPFPQEKEWLKMVNEGGVGLTMSTGALTAAHTGPATVVGNTTTNTPTTVARITSTGNNGSLKRPRSPNRAGGDDDDSHPPPVKTSHPPANDVYRSRQRFRVNEN